MRRLTAALLSIAILTTLLALALKLNIVKYPKPPIPKNSTQWLFSVDFYLNDKATYVTNLKLNYNQVKQAYDKLESILGADNIQLIAYTPVDTSYSGFTAQLTQYGWDMLPNNAATHANMNELLGYHLTYNNPRYIGPILQPTSESELFACSSNSDCVVANRECCGCQNGGSSTAINGKYRYYWEKKLRDTCGTNPINCITVYMCKPNPAVCLENKCTIAP